MPQGNVTAHGPAGGAESHAAHQPTATWPRPWPCAAEKSRAIAPTRPCSLVVFVVFVLYVLYVLGIAPTLCTAQSAMPAHRPPPMAPVFFVFFVFFVLSVLDKRPITV